MATMTDWQWPQIVMDALDQDPGETVDIATYPPTVAAEFLVIGLVCWCAAIFAALVQGLPLRSLVAPTRSFRWNVVRKIVLLTVVLYVAIGLVSSLAPSDIEMRFTGIGPDFIAWCVPMLVVILIQTSGEDVFFKGWLLHRLGALAGVAWVAVTLSITIFVALHVGNPDFGELRLILPVFAFSEVVIVYLIMRTGGLEIAFVLHFLNNAMITLLFAEEVTQANELTLFVTETLGADQGLVATEVMETVLYCLHFSALLILVVWKRSPFFIERHELDASLPDADTPDPRPMTVIEA